MILTTTNVSWVDGEEHQQKQQQQQMELSMLNSATGQGDANFEVSKVYAKKSLSFREGSSADSLCSSRLVLLPFSS